LIRSMNIGLENWPGDSNKIVFTVDYINVKFCVVLLILLVPSVNNPLVRISACSCCYGVVSYVSVTGGWT
jgi:hypothetical protein